MHRDDGMSGAPAAKLGGRFVAAGTKAWYVLDSEQTLLQRKPPPPSFTAIIDRIEKVASAGRSSLNLRNV
jgi:hypothetical protein